ncbi:MAG: hypothetical protein IKX56_02585 [Muribaculaceae bacterium]|nr:hypothetical protein [Muribaculaceae bacterium]
MTSPLLVPALANPLTTAAAIGGGWLGQKAENKLISDVSDGKYHNWHELVDSWDGVMGNMNNAENLYSNLFDPGIILGGAAGSSAGGFYEKPIPDIYNATKAFVKDINTNELNSNFWKNLIIDVAHPRRSVVEAINEERYPINTRIFTKTANALLSEARTARNKSIDMIAERLKASPERDLLASDALIDKSAARAKTGDIFIDPNY